MSSDTNSSPSIFLKFYRRFIKHHVYRFFPPSDLLPFSVRELKRRVIFSPTGVIHVGAHIGAEVPTYRRLGINKIHLIEPQPFAIKLLLRNYSRSNDVFIHNLALGSSPGEFPMYVEPGLYNSPNTSASASLLEPDAHLKDYPYVKFTKSQFLVKVVTLDSLCINHCDLLVIDTQGFDFEVLKGAKNTLLNLNWIICEYWSNNAYVNACTLDQIKSYLLDFGFKPVLQSYDRTCGDVLFAKHHLIK